VLTLQKFRHVARVNSRPQSSLLFLVGGAWVPEKFKSPFLSLGASHLCGKTGRSGGKSNGTGFSTGNFSEKKEYLQRYSSFLTGFSKQMESAPGPGCSKPD